MGNFAYPLMGENRNHLESLKKLGLLESGAGSAAIYGEWHMPAFPRRWIRYVNYTALDTFLIAPIQVSYAGEFLMNSAYSVYKVTFVPFFRDDNNADNLLYGTYYKAGTVFGKDMLVNEYPSTVATNSTYALFTNQGDTTLNLYSCNTWVGKCGMQDLTAGWPIIGQWRIFLWYRDEYAMLRVNVM